MGLSIGVAATVARRIGEHDPERRRPTAVQGIVLGLVVAVLFGVAGYVFAPRLLGLMGASPAVIATGTDYARIMLGGNVAIMLLFLINAIFRGAGDAAIAMRVLWFANAINILLGPCLIFGLGTLPRDGRGRRRRRDDVRPQHGRPVQLYALAATRATGCGSSAGTSD